MEFFLRDANRKGMSFTAHNSPKRKLCDSSCFPVRIAINVFFLRCCSSVINDVVDSSKLLICITSTTSAVSCSKFCIRLWVNYTSSCSWPCTVVIKLVSTVEISAIASSPHGNLLSTGEIFSLGNSKRRILRKSKFVSRFQQKMAK